MPSRQILGSNCRKDQMSFSLTNSVVLSMLGCYRYNVAQTTKLCTHINTTRYPVLLLYWSKCYVLHFDSINIRNLKCQKYMFAMLVISCKIVMF